MVDVGTMIQRLALLEQYVDELRRYQPLTFKEFQADSHNYWAVERGMHLCAQVVVDIANHILAAESPLQVHDYAQAIHRLGEEGILPGKFAEQFADVAKFRNRLCVIGTEPSKDVSLRISLSQQGASLWWSQCRTKITLTWSFSQFINNRSTMSACVNCSSP